MRTLAILLICLFWSSALSGQRLDTLANRVTTIGLEYGVQWPGGDLSDRFGQHFTLGTSLQWTSLRQPYFLGAFGYFQFGTQVREDVLEPFRTTDGGIINPAQEFVQVYLRQRGLQTGIEGGINLRKSAGRGLWILEPGLQAGWLSHHIRIQDESVSLPYLQKPYRAAYDRLSSGPALGGIIHVLYLQHQKLVNVRMDLYVTRAFTRLRRTIQNDAPGITEIRRDWIYGVRLAWMIPVYGGIAVEDIYY
ncbi:MAG TPA: hypothetical protein PK643_18185 [Saprospiraceae bacterium]|nr:hypothetical protein [Saprospiraceae bacterium]